MVIGHVERGLIAGRVIERTPWVGFVDDWIYSFHMPLFFFLSGLFLCWSSAKGRFTRFLSDKLRTLAYPYFVWSTVVILLKSSLDRIPNTPRTISDLLFVPIEPVEQFWFLYALFMVLILFGALISLGINPGILI